MTKVANRQTIRQSESEKERIKNHFDVIVVGGGASGMMAAGRVDELGKSVLIL